jgi:hypothetical protein
MTLVWVHETASSLLPHFLHAQKRLKPALAYIHIITERNSWKGKGNLCMYDHVCVWVCVLHAPVQGSQIIYKLFCRTFLCVILPNLTVTGTKWQIYCLATVCLSENVYYQSIHVHYFHSTVYSIPAPVIATGDNAKMSEQCQKLFRTDHPEDAAKWTPQTMMPI